MVYEIEDYEGIHADEVAAVAALRDTARLAVLEWGRQVDGNADELTRLHVRLARAEAVLKEKAHTQRLKTEGSARKS